MDLVQPVCVEEEPRLVFAPRVDEPIQGGVAEQGHPTITEFDHLEFVDLTLFIGLHREIDHGRTVNLSCADLLFTHNGTLPTLRGFMRGPAR